jgi:hypothetical protein
MVEGNATFFIHIPRPTRGHGFSETYLPESAWGGLAACVLSLAG